MIQKCRPSNSVLRRLKDTLLEIKSVLIHLKRNDQVKKDIIVF